MANHLLVPHGVSDRSADLWLATIDAAPDASFTCRVGANDVALDVAGWTRWDFGGRRIWHRLLKVSGLEPRTRHAAALRAGATVLAEGAVTTMPSDLPRKGDTPFTVLLGSCFCRRKDDAGDVGRTFFNLPAGAAPDLKILCGDQVYLDSPWFKFALPHRIATLQSLFVENYVATWGQQDGFQTLLAAGANYFVSDDHEFWNNAPNRGTYAVDTWTQASRDAWMQAAQQLYTVFQSPDSTNEFAVGPLSVFLADTRRNRDPDRKRLMTDADFARLRGWVDGLSSPGVLVVGQPIFDVAHGFKGHFFDWGFADYEQYRQLVRVLTGTRRSIVVLTGDVHYGRVARCTVPSGAELVEVISSPLALVDKSAGGSWDHAPQVFPMVDVTGVAKMAVETVEDFTSFQNQFLTLEFTARDPGAIDLTVKYWPIVGSGQGPNPTVVFATTLH